MWLLHYHQIQKLHIKLVIRVASEFKIETLYATDEILWQSYSEILADLIYNMLEMGMAQQSREIKVPENKCSHLGAG